jgi:hypothetical protein
MFEGLVDPDKNCSRAATVMINCLLKERGKVLLEKVRVWGQDQGGAWCGGGPVGGGAGARDPVAAGLGRVGLNKWSLTDLLPFTWA